MTKISEWEGARKNLLRSAGLRDNRHELKRRRTGRTTAMLLNVLQHQGPAKVIGFHIKQASFIRDHFVGMLKDMGIPYDNEKAKMVVRVRKFGPRGGTFEVAFTSTDFLENHSDDKKDPEYLKTFFDEE